MTDTIDIDPYAPPRARVIAEPKAGDYENFQRISTWWVFLLLIVTFGFYLPYWLYTRIKALNAMLPSEAIAEQLPVALVLLYVVQVWFSIAFQFQPQDFGVIALLNLVQWASFIVGLVCTFKFRNRLNQYAEAGRGDRYWLGGVATFFLHVLYLNYKLNQRIDAERAADVSGNARVVSGPVQA